MLSLDKLSQLLLRAERVKESHTCDDRKLMSIKSRKIEKRLLDLTETFNVCIHWILNVNNCLI